ncbi:hypothetical protein WA026_009144 [Henosepilachna vigintioctopunctata]|uniref:Uncharacterized protein n=1 Tax=Henosepilachna vigintioctopunctata TaxID=420089 RepID=A0AAW1UVJ3_9CUCU
MNRFLYFLYGLLLSTDVSALIRLALALFPTIFGVGRTSLGVTTPKDVDGRPTAKAGGNLSEDSDVEVVLANGGLDLVHQANFGD